MLFSCMPDLFFCSEEAFKSLCPAVQVQIQLSAPSFLLLQTIHAWSWDHYWHGCSIVQPSSNRLLISTETFCFTTTKALKDNYKVKACWLVPKKKKHTQTQTISPLVALYVSVFFWASHSEKLLGAEPCSVSEKKNGKLFPTWGCLPL